jgi:hypothetical protein
MFAGSRTSEASPRATSSPEINSSVPSRRPRCDDPVEPRSPAVGSFGANRCEAHPHYQGLHLMLLAGRRGTSVFARCSAVSGGALPRMRHLSPTPSGYAVLPICELRITPHVCPSKEIMRVLVDRVTRPGRLREDQVQGFGRKPLISLASLLGSFEYRPFQQIRGPLPKACWSCRGYW